MVNEGEPNVAWASSQLFFAASESEHGEDSFHQEGDSIDDKSDNSSESESLSKFESFSDRLSFGFDDIQRQRTNWRKTSSTAIHQSGLWISCGMLRVWISTVSRGLLAITYPNSSFGFDRRQRARRRQTSKRGPRHLSKRFTTRLGNERDKGSRNCRSRCGEDPATSEVGFQLTAPQVLLRFATHGLNSW